MVDFLIDFPPHNVPLINCRAAAGDVPIVPPHNGPPHDVLVIPRMMVPHKELNDLTELNELNEEGNASI